MGEEERRTTRGERGGNDTSKELQRHSSFLRHNVAVISIQNSGRRIPLTRCVSKVTVNSPPPPASPPPCPDTVTLTQAPEGHSQVSQVTNNCLNRDLDSVKSAIVQIVQEKQGYLEENGALKKFRKANDDLKNDMKLLIIENSRLKDELMKAKESNSIRMNRKKPTYVDESDNCLEIPRYGRHIKSVEEFVGKHRCSEEKSPDQPRRSPDGQEAEKQGGKEWEKEERGNAENVRLLHLKHVQVVKGLLEEILRYESVRLRIQEECNSLRCYRKELQTQTISHNSPSTY